MTTISPVTVSQDQPLALLEPAEVFRPGPEDIECYYRTGASKLKRDDVAVILSGLSGLLALDIETEGTQAAHPHSKIVGIGLANDNRALYLDLASLDELARSFLFDWINSRANKLVGHNIFFDGTFLLRDSGQWANWKYCTYGLYRQLANEGYPQQRWGLKDAQVELLGWSDTNEYDLDIWLIENNYISNIKKEPAEGYYRCQVDNETRYAKPDKSKMSKAPALILGRYCALDAYSTYMLLTQVLLPSLNKLTGTAKHMFIDYHQKTFLSNVSLLAEQQLTGVTVDTVKLRSYKEQLTEEIVQAEIDFLNHPDAVPFISEYNKKIVDEHLSKEPAKFKKLPALGTQPPKLKKDGTVSKNWENWEAKRIRILELGPGEVSKNWEVWDEKRKELESTNQFNLNSGPQKQWLFYDCLKYPVLLHTDTGQPAVDNKALLGFGELGRLLKTNNDKVKELGYINACLEHTIKKDNDYDRIHPQFRVPGTLTGRLAGSGGLNFQQLPKSRGYLECYMAKPGYVWVDCDIASLEQVVLAEESRDPTLWKLYGPGAKANDVYLFNGAYLPGLGEKIREAGYDPDNPTKESIARAKKEAKQARQVSKIITLGSSYGMGPTKLQMTLKLQGIDISYEEARRMHSSYWELYAGVKQYEANLVTSWKRNGGWVYNGIGRPVCVAHDYLKDIVNRVIQSTGHDICMMIIEELKKLREETGIWYTGVCWDFHDQSIVECKEEDAGAVVELFNEAYRRLNQRLGGDILIKGEPQVVTNLADAKLEG